MNKGNDEPSVEIEKLDRYRAALVVLFLLVSANYFIWRLSSFNESAYIFSIIVYCAEFFGIVTTSLHLFMTWNLTVRTSPPILEGRTVDVFVPTYNESTELLRRTLIAAKNLRYPCKIWLLDDGCRDEMRELAVDLDVEYIARSDNEHAKAGNLNNALKYSEGEFIAIFDSDHAPHTNFITNTIGYFRDESVALVQTPQDFYNLDSYQHRKTKSSKRIWTEQSLFFRVIQRGKDYWNAAFFCGSCAIVRRSALEGIGGIATGTITEDLHTSIRLHSAGHKSVYHSETLAYGLAPSTISPFLSQRIRWGQGAMEVWKQEGILFNSGLTLAQRLNYFASMVTYFDGWTKGVFYLAPVIVLLTGLMPIKAITTEFLMHFIPYFILTFWVFEEVGRGYGQTYLTEQYNMARFAAFAWATLGLIKSPGKFRVTSKKTEESNTAFSNTVPQLLVTSLNVLAIPLGLVLFAYLQHLPTEGVIANIIWATVNAVLGLGILKFTFNNQKFKRNDYRFPIPLPIKLNGFNKNVIYATVDDISASGCKIYGDISKAIFKGNITGDLILPTGNFPISAQLATRFVAGNDSDEYTVAYGAKFAFSDDSQRNEMEHFLFGSSLQYDIQGMSERGHTPLEKLKLFFAKNSHYIDNQNITWSTALPVSENISDNEDVDVMLLSEFRFANFARDIISFKRMPMHVVTKINVFRRTGQYAMSIKILKEKRIESPLGPLYKYKILACELPDGIQIDKEKENRSEKQHHSLHINNVYELVSKSATG